jgi:hypothetical protein
MASKFDSKINDFFGGFKTAIKDKFPSLLADAATEFYKERFNTKEWNNVPWVPAKNPPARGSLMQRSTNLQSSVRPSTVSPTKVIISAGSSQVPYARVHNEGLRIKGIQNVRAYTNKNLFGKGKQIQIKAHTRSVDFQMPKRQFMGKSEPLFISIKQRFKAEFKAYLK